MFPNTCSTFNLLLVMKMKKSLEHLMEWNSTPGTDFFNIDYLVKNKNSACKNDSDGSCLFPEKLVLNSR